MLGNQTLNFNDNRPDSTQIESAWNTFDPNFNAIMDVYDNMLKQIFDVSGGACNAFPSQPKSWETRLTLNLQAKRKLS